MKQRRKKSAHKGRLRPSSTGCKKLYFRALDDCTRHIAERDALQAELDTTRQNYERAVPDIVALINETKAHKDALLNYKRRLGDLLDADQKEAAQITGCPEDEYAIQLIRLCKRKIDELTRFT